MLEYIDIMYERSFVLECCHELMTFRLIYHFQLVFIQGCDWALSIPEKVTTHEVAQPNACATGKAVEAGEKIEQLCYILPLQLMQT